MATTTKFSALISNLVQIQKTIISGEEGIGPVGMQTSIIMFRYFARRQQHRRGATYQNSLTN